MTDLRGDVVVAVGQLRALADRLEDAVMDKDESSMTLYSQRDARWRDTVYAGGMTFGKAGCYVTCVAMLASLAGYADEPPEVARRLAQAGCFAGAQLSFPQRIPQAYPLLVWEGRRDWRNWPADLDWLRQQLDDGPVILEVEFVPGGAQPPDDQHFVVAEAFTLKGDDLLIADPWDGSATRLLERYALEHWDLARAIYGARLLRA